MMTFKGKFVVMVGPAMMSFGGGFSVGGGVTPPVVGSGSARRFRFYRR